MKEKSEVLVKDLEWFRLDATKIKSVKEELKKLEIQGKPIVRSVFFERYITPSLLNFFERRNKGAFWPCPEGVHFRGFLRGAFKGDFSPRTLTKYWQQISVDEQMARLQCSEFLPLVIETGYLIGLKLLYQTFKNYVKEFPKEDYNVVWEIKKALLLPSKFTECVASLLEMAVEFSKESDSEKRDFWQKQFNLGDSEMLVESGQTPFLKFFADLYFQHTANCFYKYNSTNNIAAFHDFLQKHLTTREEVQQVINQINLKLQEVDPFKGNNRIAIDENEKNKVAQLIVDQCHHSLLEFAQTAFPAEGLQGEAAEDVSVQSALPNF
jgi:hypothetical protein